MDTRKLSAHPTGDKTEGMENSSHLNIGEERAASYVDTDIANEAVRRWNAHSYLVDALRGMSADMRRLADGASAAGLRGLSSDCMKRANAISFLLNDIKA